MTFVDRHGQRILDMSEGDQAELRSLRGHLDTTVVERLRQLDAVGEAAAHYVTIVGSLAPMEAKTQALWMLTTACDRAGYEVPIRNVV